MKRVRIMMSLGMIALIAVSSCVKSSGSDDIHAIDYSDSSKPVVNITLPISNQSFTSGDVISIKGKVTDNSLYKGTITIKDDATNTIMKQQEYDIHNYQVYEFELEYQANVFVVSNYTITVEFGDHGLNQGSQSVKIRINP